MGVRYMNFYVRNVRTLNTLVIAWSSYFSLVEEVLFISFLPKIEEKVIGKIFQPSFKRSNNYPESVDPFRAPLVRLVKK